MVALCVGRHGIRFRGRDRLDAEREHDHKVRRAAGAHDPDAGTRLSHDRQIHDRHRQRGRDQDRAAGPRHDLRRVRRNGSHHRGILQHRKDDAVQHCADPDRGLQSFLDVLNGRPEGRREHGLDMDRRRPLGPLLELQPDDLRHKDADDHMRYDREDDRHRSGTTRHR